MSFVFNPKVIILWIKFMITDVRCKFLSLCWITKLWFKTSAYFTQWPHLKILSIQWNAKRFESWLEPRLFGLLNILWSYSWRIRLPNAPDHPVWEELQFLLGLSFSVAIWMVFLPIWDFSWKHWLEIVPRSHIWNGLKIIFQSLDFIPVT